MLRNLLLLAIVLGYSATALAHHPLAGLPMTSFSHGILSGFAHPVIGIDHLFFVLAVGVSACFAKSRLSGPVFYLGGMFVGIAVVMSGFQFAYVELIIALSLMLLGLIIVTGRALTMAQARILFVVIGLFHGYAFGEVVVGVEAVSIPVLAGYLIGLTSIQWLLAILAGYFATKAWALVDSTELRPRLMGAVTLGVGITFFVEIAESMLLSV